MSWSWQREPGRSKSSSIPPAVGSPTLRYINLAISNNRSNIRGRVTSTTCSTWEVAEVVHSINMKCILNQTGAAASPGDSSGRAYGGCRVAGGLSERPGVWKGPQATPVAALERATRAQRAWLAVRGTASVHSVWLIVPYDCSLHLFWCTKWH